jgi:hypothetical protein
MMKKIEFVCVIALQLFLLCFSSFGQGNGDIKTVTLEARVSTKESDNYTKAAFSFKRGANGDEGRKLTRNNWDILYGNNPGRDGFDVSMVVDDCSRILDLGKHQWSELFDLPQLSAYLEPTREPSVKALEGHMYLVRSKDQSTDHLSLFRVEKVTQGKSVTISWKLVSDLMPSPKQ